MIVTERIARKFDAIIDAEFAARGAQTLAIYGIDYATRERGKRDLIKTRAAMNALIDELTMEEATEFGPYRRAALQAAKGKH